MKNRNHQSEFKFRKNDRIGSAAAEDDEEFLINCFYDTGDLALLSDIDDNRQIIVGRTGTGKSALLRKLKDENNGAVIDISPENLALTYVSNSTILTFFESIGVNLDPFFKLLWRHIFTVEILTKHFESHNTVERKSIFDHITQLFSSNSRKDKEIREAIDYLKNWGEKFWLETEFRVKEITQKVEDDLKAQLNGKISLPFAEIGGVLSSETKLTGEQKSELKSRGQEIISTAQVQDLTKVLKLLDSVLDDKQKRYFILIDKLDENWVEERLRYKLIMSLIVTARELTKVKNVKIILSLRRDLVDRVFKLCRDSGFQEEKFQSLYLPLLWKKSDLIEILDRRIDYLVRRRHTRKKVSHLDLLPKKFNKKDITEYISTMVRNPRDIICFFNKCIETASELTKLQSTELKIAEGEYSRSRIRALADEWSADYPNLLDFVSILNGRPQSFKLSNITEREIDDVCLNIASEYPQGQGILNQSAIKLTEGIGSSNEIKKLLIQILFKIGLVGLKLQPYEKETWNDDLGKIFSFSDIEDTTSIVIHPIYYRALGIKLKDNN